MTDVQQVLAQAVVAAVVAEWGEEHRGVDALVRPSSHADFQSNVALSLAKKVGLPPRDVAAKIVDHLALAGIAAPPEISGPGFLNITLEQSWLVAQLDCLGPDRNYGIVAPDQTDVVVIDYSAPNVAKEMHIGHLRSTVIGDALARMNAALGHQVIGQNHVGDWGTPFGMLIEHMLDIGEAEASEQLASGQFTAFYQAARKKFDADEDFSSRARQRVVTLQSKEPESLRLWQKLVDDSRAYFTVVYQRLGVLLADDQYAPESSYHDALDGVVEELLSAGVAEMSDGAVCFFDPAFTGKDDQPVPLIIRKSDGGYGYGATDLACIKHRVQELGATRLLYVVGAPQAMHFAQVYQCGHKAGWLADINQAQHIKFGSVLGSDRKMFRSRSGDTVKLIDVIDEAISRATDALAERDGLTKDQISQIAQAVGIGALKYADLSTSREKDYVFDWDRMLSFQGDTGPYLQYAVARINSLLSKADTTRDAAMKLPADGLTDPHERQLMLQLLAFSAELTSAVSTSEPHKLCTYLLSLAGAFTQFYEACPIMKAGSGEVRDARLKLAALTASTLEHGLSLLGISSPREM